MNREQKLGKMAHVTGRPATFAPPRDYRGSLIVERLQRRRTSLIVRAFITCVAAAGCVAADRAQKSVDPHTRNAQSVPISDRWRSGEMALLLVLREETNEDSGESPMR